MASRTSTTSDYASAFRHLFEATELLEQWVESVSRASTSFYSANQGTPQAPSQVTVAVSQVTVHGPARSAVLSAGSTQSSDVPEVKPSPPNYGGLEKDKEGVETRKEMLARRRKECQAEEVDVALAPVLKINVPFCFYPEQYKRFRTMFPRVNVDSGLAYTHHDHPVAHTATMVGIRRVQSILAPRQLALDLHGNPNGNEQYNRFQGSRLRKRPGLPEPPVIDTLVEMRSAADAPRRATKWGKEIGDDGIRRYFEMPIDAIPANHYDVFLSIHTLYYYSMYDVNALLAKNRNSKIVALVNYSPEQSGTLYGELRYTKSGGMTTQHSPNGEKYHHPDIDPWFQTSSFRGLTETLGCGISWTSTCIGGPLYVLTITPCEWVLARHKRYDPPGAPTLQVVGANKFLGFVNIGGKTVKLNVSNVDLAAELRHFMVFRDRQNPQTFADLCVKARRVTGRDVLEGSRMYEVNDGDLQDHIIYAYLVDAPGELQLMEGVKLLRGELLEPLSESLKLQGKEVRDTLMSALTSWLFERKTVEALGSRSKQKPPIIAKNTAGLLPIKRT